MHSLQLLGAVVCLHAEVWVARCLFSGKHREARSPYHGPAVCLSYSIQHFPPCVREPFFFFSSCILARTSVLFEGLGSQLVPSFSLSFTSSHGRKRLLFLVRLQKGPELWALFLRLAARRMETFSSLLLSHGKNGWSPALDIVSLQNSGVRGRPPTLECVSAISPILPTYGSRLRQGWAILKIIWLQDRISLSAPTQPSIKLLFSSPSDCKQDYF